MIEDFAQDDTTASDFSDGQGLSRAERRDQQRQRIMDAAKLCFVRSGFQGASMQQVCAEAGMSPGALYRYFVSKEAIVEAIVEADRQEDMHCFGALGNSGSAVEGIVEAAMTHIMHVHEKGSAPLFAEMRSESMRNEAIRQTVDGHKMQVAGLIQAVLHDAIESGEIDPVVDLQTLMAVLMAVGEGMALNDLPGRGVDVGKLESAIRAMVVGMMRPTGRPPKDT